MSNKTTAMIGVNYQEFKPKTYQSTVVSIGDNDKFFDSGNPQEDYNNASEYANNNSSKVFNLSSVDNFISDGGMSVIH
ncbi:MAG: hypothetical protein KAJ39_01350 [Gammaproteobacteria bacterium]|nr:hypothetical protein [Gammaproteobacteria bacterium]